MRWQISAVEKVPEKPKVPTKQGIRSGMKSVTLENLTLVTPMLGGGVESLKVDREMPVRVQAIRGQLRFWWRTFQKEKSIQELRNREATIWGSTQSASKVTISLEVTDGNWRTIPYRRETKPRDTELPKYAIFPLDNTKDEISGQYIQNFELIAGGRFDLKMDYDQRFEHDALNSLKLWLLFGGLGARTRRGMGTVYSPKWPGWKNRGEVMQWLKNLAPELDDGAQRPWPVLAGAQVLAEEAMISPTMDVNILWKKWIERYQGFRQHRINKKTGKRSPFGKSTWPEPKAIRKLHSSRQLDKSAYFPRGAFGLPIVFHFKDEGWDDTLVGKKGGETLDRWASPVILKVFRLNEKTAVRLCLKLNSPLPEGFRLEGNHNADLPDLAYPLAKKHPEPPLNGLDPYSALFKAMSNTDPVRL